MASRALTVLSTLSVLLGITAVGFWQRSGEGREEIQFRWRGREYAFASEAGRVGVDNQPELRQFAVAVELAQQEVRDSTAAYRGGSDNNDPYLAQMIRASDCYYTLIGRRPPPVRHVIPYWAILVAALVLPGIWAGRAWRWHGRQLRLAANRCAECGYDLRATSNRCPECGTAIPATILSNEASP